MKFTDGYWQIREGVTPYYPVQVYDIVREPDAMTVFAPTREIRSRGDTLGQPALTIRFSSPLENVIRVQMVHYKSVQPPKPEFILYEQSHLKLVISEDEQCATLMSGDLSVRVQKGKIWLVEYKAGERVITSSSWRGMP